MYGPRVPLARDSQEEVDDLTEKVERCGPSSMAGFLDEDLDAELRPFHAGGGEEAEARQLGLALTQPTDDGCTRFEHVGTTGVVGWRSWRPRWAQSLGFVFAVGGLILLSAVGPWPLASSVAAAVAATGAKAQELLPAWLRVSGTSGSGSGFAEVAAYSHENLEFVPQADRRVLNAVEYTLYPGVNAYGVCGAQDIDSTTDAQAFDIASCKDWCTRTSAETGCICVAHSESSNLCYRRKDCRPKHFCQAPAFNVWVRKAHVIPARASPRRMVAASQIVWSEHPDKCFDVFHGLVRNGNVVQLYTCNSDSAFMNTQLLAPPAGTTGKIRWATHPEKCLDAPGIGRAVIWWDCDSGLSENMLFVMPVGDEGFIRMAAQPNWCIDVPGGENRNGRRLQLWRCNSAHQANMRFRITRPYSPTPQAYDCAAGLHNCQTGWSAAKKEWCAKNKDIQCQSYDCTLGLIHCTAGWSQEKKTWCKVHKNLDCEVVVSTRTTTMTTTSTTSTTLTTRVTMTTEAPKVSMDVMSAKARVSVVSWAKNPRGCLDVRTGSAKNGNVIQLWECNGKHFNMRLLLPEPGRTGLIRWPGDTSQCLDAPGVGHSLFWWDCSKGTLQNMLFRMPFGSTGAISMAAHPDRCVSVSPGDRIKGRRLQLIKCSTSDQGNLIFRIHGPDYGETSRPSTTTVKTTTALTTVEREDNSKDITMIGNTRLVIAFIATVRNVDYTKLCENMDLSFHFKDGVQQALAKEAGGHVTPKNVVVALMPGSVSVKALIMPFEGVHLQEAYQRLRSSDSLTDTVKIHVMGVRGIEGITTGPLEVGSATVSLQAPPEEEGARRRAAVPPPSGAARTHAVTTTQAATTTSRTHMTTSRTQTGTTTSSTSTRTPTRSSTQTSTSTSSTSTTTIFTWTTTSTTMVVTTKTWTKTSTTSTSTPSKDVVFINWAEHPSKCLDARNNRADNGNVVQIWSCSDSPSMQLLVPAAGGTGKIRWAGKPDQCLDAPGRHDLIWWNCRDSSNDNVMWTMPVRFPGVIRLAAKPDLCLDVDGDVGNGVRLILHSCYGQVAKFNIRSFLDCWWWCDANKMFLARSGESTGSMALR